MKIIYNDSLCDYVQKYSDDIIACLKENNIDPSLENIDNEAQACIDADFEYIKELLITFDNRNNKKIYVSAVLGLWYGKRQAFKIFNSLSDAVAFCLEDVNALYFKKVNDALTLCATHHDGNNIFKFYTIEKYNRKKAINYNMLYEGILWKQKAKIKTHLQLI